MPQWPKSPRPQTSSPHGAQRLSGSAGTARPAQNRRADPGPRSFLAAPVPGLRKGPADGSEGDFEFECAAPHTVQYGLPRKTETYPEPCRPDTRSFPWPGTSSQKTWPAFAGAATHCGEAPGPFSIVPSPASSPGSPTLGHGLRAIPASGGLNWDSPGRSFPSELPSGSPGFWHPWPLPAGPAPGQWRSPGR